MKCIHCDNDSRYPERRSKKCPRCGREFAFEPREGDPVTDRLFQKAIDMVSAQGQVRWGVENLYYEVCRRKRTPRMPVGCIIAALVLSIVPVPFALALNLPGLWAPAAIFFIAAFIMACINLSKGYVSLESTQFSSLWKRWCDVQGTPKGLIQRQPQPSPPRAVEPDVADYSFDRVVVCDRARTVDLLLANKFHFENNCAILSIDGYPPGPFATVKAMLKRNPRLQVYVLHDATPAGCRLAYQLATDPEWFAGMQVIDVGLRPAHSQGFHGLYQPAKGDYIKEGQSINKEEAAWLSTYILELAAFRPEQVLKRLFHAINRDVPDDESRPTETAQVADDPLPMGAAWIVTDDYSFGGRGQATHTDGGVDSFG